MATHRFIKGAVEKMKYLVKGATKKLEHVVKYAVEQPDDVAESDIMEQDYTVKGSVKEPDHNVQGVMKKQGCEHADKKQVRVIEAAGKEKDDVVQGTVKVHDHATKNAAMNRGHCTEDAMKKQVHIIKDTVNKLDNAVKGVDEEQEFYAGLEDFRRKYSAEAKALRHYKRPGLLTIKEEDKTRDGEPIHNFLEIFQRNRYGEPLTTSRLDPPVLLSPISSIASTVPPEPCLFSKCCARIRKNARRNQRKVKRASKELVEKARQQVCAIRTSSLCGCHKVRAHASKASPYWASSHSYQSVKSLPIASFSSFQLPPLEF
ncbi:hypothetical protein SEPCBS57363_001428 [Sporothrix epigloea]|uniref:Uncharacterized protein n=1 Tax=Sporothrix epigloea TaxID=1892477 RepID=A0ABP0DBS6_9PEZI